METKSFGQEIIRGMGPYYKAINTDLLVVLTALTGTSILTTSDIESRIYELLERELSWEIDTGDIGKACNRLFRLGLFQRYKRRVSKVKGDFFDQNLYSYSVSPDLLERDLIIAQAALKVFGENNASVVELTQSRFSVNTIRLLLSLFPGSTLILDDQEYGHARRSFDRGRCRLSYTDLMAMNGFDPATLNRQIQNLDDFGYTVKEEHPKRYGVAKSLGDYKCGNPRGKIDRTLLRLAVAGHLSEGKEFTLDELYGLFEEKPDRDVLRRKVNGLVGSYLGVAEEQRPVDYLLTGKAERIGLYFLIPLQRYIMGRSTIDLLREEASTFEERPSELGKCVTIVLENYARISGHVGK